MYTQTEKVNIEPKSYLPVFRVSQNDVGRTLKAHLISDEGTITIPQGATVTMAGTKPSGLGYTATGTIDGSDVSFETDATMTDEAGQIQSEIRIVVGETLIGTTNVILNVEPNPHPSDTTDGQREPLVNEITALLEQITEQAERVEEYSSKVLNMTVSAHESEEPTVTKTEGEVVNLDFGLPRGAKGERGERGEQGEAGKDGKDGIDGKDGKDGINGITPDFSIGTVTTLEPTESASVTLTGTEEEPVLNFGIPKGEQGEVSLNDLKKIMVTDSASGSIASFPDGSDLLPALSLIANIIPQQSGSGTPSPENVRPISGWESVETSVCGKNWLDRLKIETADKYVNLANNYWYTAPIKLKPNTQYTISPSLLKSLGVSDYWVLYINPSESDEDYLVITNQSIIYPVYEGLSRTLTFTTGATGVIRFGVTNVSGEPKPSALEAFMSVNWQIELGSSASSYEPYITPTTHTTDLGRTVYGGTVDVVSGVLTVDKGFITLDGDETFATGSSGMPFRMTLPDDYKKTTNNMELAGFTTNQMTEVAQAAPWGTVGTCAVVANTAYFYFKLASDLTDISALRTYLASNPLQICYPLATPQTYTLTPQQINTLQGVNNVWADSGDCSITYYADTKLYIDKKLGGS